MCFFTQQEITNGLYILYFDKDCDGDQYGSLVLVYDDMVLENGPWAGNQYFSSGVFEAVKIDKSKDFLEQFGYEVTSWERV